MLEDLLKGDCKPARDGELVRGLIVAMGRSQELKTQDSRFKSSLGDRIDRIWHLIRFPLEFDTVKIGL